jgi:membrane protease YdiL (CAAX protease family)
MSIAVTVVAESAFTILLIILMSFGVIQYEQLSLPNLGISNTAYVFLNIGLYVFVYLIPPIVVALCCKRKYNPFSPTKPVGMGFAFFAILAAVGLCMFTNIINSYFTAIFTQMGAEVPEAPQTMEMTLTSLGLNLLSVAVLPALLEEMVYRGYILRTLRPYGNVFAIVVSSMLFSLMHGNLRQVPFAFIVGLVLGFLYVLTDNIWMTITVHFANNSISLLMEYFGFSLSDNAIGYFNATIIYGLSLIGGLALIVLFTRYKQEMRIRKMDTHLTASKRAATLFATPLFLMCVILYVVLLIMGAV